MFVDQFSGSEQVVLDASPAAVFALITNVDRLPEWNEHIHHVIAPAGGPLGPGSEWVVQMRVMHTRWPSRAVASVVDRDNLRFEHTSRSDDGNPSYVLWTWQVRSAGRRTELTVTWVGRPRTFWRRALLARVRAPQLRDEVRSTLAGLGSHLVAERVADR
jgi:uncharacterized protein YndB with AHSA1/START domain